jgi:hypothetical protein
MMFANVFTTDGIRIVGIATRGATTAIIAAERALHTRNLPTPTVGRPLPPVETGEAEVIGLASFVDDGNTI